MALASEKLRLLRRGWGTRMVLRHVPRERNVLADWLTNVARADSVSLDLTVALQPYQLSAFSDPPWEACLGSAPLVSVAAESQATASEWVAAHGGGAELRECVTAAAAALRGGHALLDLPCPACGVLVADLGSSAVRPRVVRRCLACGKRVQSSRRGVASPLACLQPGLDGEVLTLGRAPETLAATRGLLVRAVVHCTYCGQLHEDLQRWATFNHCKHLCSGCHRYFWTKEPCVGVR